MRGPCRRRAVNAMAPPRKRPSRRARRPAPPALQLPQTETLLHLGGAKFVTEAVRATYEPMPFILGAMKRLNFSLLRALAALAALASVAAGAFVGPVKFVGCGSGCGGRHMPPRARARADACTPQRRLVVCAVGADGAAQEGSSAVDAMEFCLIDSGNFKRLEQFGPLRVQVGLPLRGTGCKRGVLVRVEVCASVTVLVRARCAAPVPECSVECWCAHGLDGHRSHLQSAHCRQVDARAKGLCMRERESAHARARAIERDAPNFAYAPAPSGRFPGASGNRTRDIYVRTYIHTHIHTYIHACIHTYIHTYILYTYIHTYIHTCMHAYIHTQGEWVGMKKVPLKTLRQWHVCFGSTGVQVMCC